MTGNSNSGRRRKPLEVRLAEGETQNGYAINGKKYEVEKFDSGPPVVPVPGFEAPVCPSSLDERGVTEWEKIWYSGWWLSPDHDFRQVEMIARAYDLIDRYEAQIAIDGDTIMGRFGLEEHPLHKAIDRQRDRITRLLDILGFSPTARARLSILINKHKIGLAKLNQEKAKAEEVKTEATKMAWE
jgi:phage terminase small subunit